MAEPTSFLFPFFSPPEISSFWKTSIAITPSGTQKVLPTPVERKYSIGSSLLTFSSSMTLTYPLSSIASLAVASPLTFHLLPLLSHFSAHGKVLQNLGSDHLPFLLSVPLSPVFCPKERTLSFNFQKARWDVFASYFDFHCPSAKKYSSLSLSSAATLFTSLECGMQPNFSFLSAASNAILNPSGQLEWKQQLVKDARLLLSLTEGMKITRLTSPLSDVYRLSSPRPRLRHGRRLALLFCPNLTPNLSTLFFALLLALLPHLLLS